MKDLRTFFEDYSRIFPEEIITIDKPVDCRWVASAISTKVEQAYQNEFKSAWDFVNPKWKGKIEARDVRIPGVGSANIRRFYHNPALGPKFIKQLFGEMDITIFRDTRQGVDWLATGKFAICFFCSSRDVERAQSQGLPVASFRGLMKEGASITSSSGNIGLVNRAPHPNAAKLYVNWLLSREGQLLVQKEYSEAEAGSSNSLRMDIPKDMVPSEQRPVEGVSYLDVDTWERMSMEPVVKVLNEALEESKKSERKQNK